MIKINNIIPALVFVLLLITSCGTPQNMVYVQDIQADAMLALQEPQQITLQTGDRLTIRVHAPDDELAQMFNISYGSNDRNSSSFYTVDEKGQIDFPVLGAISVRGLTRQEVANTIKYRLLSSKMIKNPTVSVEYYNMGFSALGEVNSPGWKEIDRDQLTLLEALALCGDLTINGQRENVLVLRTVNGKQIPYRVDLTDTRSLYATPVYYVQQGDVIYVEPNETRINQSTPNGNNFRTPTFWVSMCSFLMSVIILITN